MAKSSSKGSSKSSSKSKRKGASGKTGAAQSPQVHQVQAAQTPPTEPARAASSKPPGKRVVSQRTGRRRKASPWPWLIGLGILALLVVPVVVNAVRASNLPGESFRSQGNAHIGTGAPTPDYNSNPPTSGPHYETIASWDTYLEPVADEYLVHNMEDGGVIFWYQPGTEAETEERVSALEDAVAQAEDDTSTRYRRVVIAPREEMPTVYAITAWTRLQQMGEIDQEAVNAFLQAYEGRNNHAGAGGARY